jgi:hypothetical protein
VTEPTMSVDNDLVRIDPAYLRTDRIAWTATHRHHAHNGDEPYANAYLFSYAIALPQGATALTLPRDPRLRIFAISVAKDDNAGAVPLVPLWPDLRRDAAFTRGSITREITLASRVRRINRRRSLLVRAPRFSVGVRQIRRSADARHGLTSRAMHLRTLMRKATPHASAK